MIINNRIKHIQKQRQYNHTGNKLDLTAAINAGKDSGKLMKIIAGRLFHSTIDLARKEFFSRSLPTLMAATLQR